MNPRFVIPLSPKDFDPVDTWKLRKHKCSAVLFYASWCPHCQQLMPTWEELGEKAAFFDVCAFDCEKYKGWCNKIKEDMPSLITGYPSVVIYSKGKPKERIGRNDEERKIGKLLAACMRACS